MIMSRKELLKGLNEAQIAKLNQCSNQEEILALAKQEGIELTDEQLSAISGGNCAKITCPKCGSENIGNNKLGNSNRRYVCNDCDYIF